MNKVLTIEALEDLYPGIAKMSPATTQKETAIVNDAYRKLIKSAPLFAIASCGENGLDCSPRGDGPGFVHILDDRTLAFPDRRGNNRLDTLRNIVSNPNVALLFFIPGWNETFRVNGKAYLTDDAALCERFVEKGKLPATVVVIEIETMFFQCARALKRAKFWEDSSKTSLGDLPTAGQLINSVMSTFDGKTYDETLEERQNQTMY